MKKMSCLLIVLVFTSSNTITWITPEKRDQINYDIVQTYKKISRDYRPILELFEAYNNASLIERDHFINQISKKIITEVKENNLPLYGNIFNRMWKQSRACSAEYPLKKFEATFLQDSLGHIKKAYGELIKNKGENREIERFINQLKDLGDLIKSSVYYEMEEYKVNYFTEKNLREQAESKVRNLEQILAQKKKKIEEKKATPHCTFCNR